MKAEAKEHYLAAILSDSSDAIVSTDMNKNIPSWNRGAEEIFGYTEEEILGRNASILVPDELKGEPEYLLKKIIESGNITDYETVRLNQDGDRVNVNISITAIRDSNNSIIGNSGIIRDITEKKQMEETLERYTHQLESIVEERTRELRESEKKYRDMIENSPDGIMRITIKDGVFLSVNPAYCGLLGYEPEELVGKSSLDLKLWVHPESRAKLIAILDTDEVVRDFEYDVRTKSGEIKTLSCTGRAIFNEREGMAEFEGIMRDITYRKWLEEQLKISERHAALGHLSASIGHEIRNPLGVISNSIFFLNRVIENADDKVSRHLEIMSREISVSNTIISDLLEFSSMRAPELEMTDLNALIRETINTIGLPEDVKLNFHLSEKSTKCMIDKKQMNGIFLNLTTNAVHSMPDGGYLTIRTDIGEGFIKIEVEDTGEGISDDGLDKIFEPLFTTKAKGIGLGLAIIKQYVENHKGLVTVQSREGKGTVFAVMLPLNAG